MSGEGKELFERLAKLIEDTNKKQTVELKKEIHTEISTIKDEIVTIKTILGEEKRKIHSIENRQVQLENKYINVEKTIKKNNILIFGLQPDTNANLADFTISKLNLLLGLNLTIGNINNIFLIGNPENQRPILVQFLSFLTKIQVIKECKKLQGTGISISDDLTKEEREIRKILVKHKKLAQNSGHKAYIKKDKLYVDGETYTLQELEGNENEIDETETLISSENRQVNSAPATPTIAKKNEHEEYITLEKNDTGMIEEKEGDEKKHTEAVVNGNRATSNEISPVFNPETKKRKIGVTSEATGPITRGTKRFQGKLFVKNTTEANRDDPL